MRAVTYEKSQTAFGAHVRRMELEPGLVQSKKHGLRLTLRVTVLHQPS